MPPTGSSRNPYEDVHPDDLGVNDILSADRTALSNERTLLAYIRTALTFGVAGATLLRFFEGGPVTQVTGAALIVVGIVLGVFGLIRFVSIRRRIAALEARPPHRSRHDEDEED